MTQHADRDVTGSREPPPASGSARHPEGSGEPSDRGGWGTLPTARHLTDPAIEAFVQRAAASAPPMSEDQRATLARLLRLPRRGNRPAA
jgi:hypothetical protein